MNNSMPCECWHRVPTRVLGISDGGVISLAAGARKGRREELTPELVRSPAVHRQRQETVPFQAGGATEMLREHMA